MVRLWAKVRKSSATDCWEWTASTNGAGYGMLWSPEQGRKALAHRLVYENTYGPIPVGAMVLHSCDNRACVNPDHLRLGDAKDNVRDMDERGRRVSNPRRGEDNTQSKLTAADVVALRQDYIAGMPRKEIAAKFGLSPYSVNDYVSGRSWRHITEGPSEAELRGARRLKIGAKISPDDVRDIKRRIAAGETGISIAALYNVHKATISNIKTGKTWRDI